MTFTSNGLHYLGFHHMDSKEEHDNTRSTSVLLEQVSRVSRGRVKAFLALFPSQPTTYLTIWSCLAAAGVGLQSPGHIYVFINVYINILNK